MPVVRVIDEKGTESPFIYTLFIARNARITGKPIYCYTLIHSVPHFYP